MMIMKWAAIATATLALTLSPATAAHAAAPSANPASAAVVVPQVLPLGVQSVGIANASSWLGPPAHHRDACSGYAAIGADMNTAGSAGSPGGGDGSLEPVEGGHDPAEWLPPTSDAVGRYGAG
ncbi:hypothetical protein ACIGO7_31355 [Streptomyces virginiae]|uniref:hypothetical protein n=1 Tax=Streptomyces virginiae TaxID=1961 RepID=UPI0037D25A5C